MPLPILRAAVLALVLLPFATTPNAAADDARLTELYIAAVEQALSGKEETDLGLAAIDEVPDAALPAFDKWFGANAHRMPPVYLFSYAGRVFPGDPQHGARWFFAARTRLFYDALRCRDETVVERVVEYDAARADIIDYIRTDPAGGAAAGRWAVAWEIAHDPADQPKALLNLCLTGKKGWRLAKEQGKVDAGKTSGTDEKGRPRLLVALPDVDDAADWILPASAYPQARSDAISITQRVIDQLIAAPTDEE
jgi:hypothetical protein